MQDDRAKRPPYLHAEDSGSTIEVKSARENLARSSEFQHETVTLELPVKELVEKKFEKGPREIKKLILRKGYSIFESTN